MAERVILAGIPVPQMYDLEVAGLPWISVPVLVRVPRFLGGPTSDKPPETQLVRFMRTYERRNGIPVFRPDTKKSENEQQP